MNLIVRLLLLLLIIIVVEFYFTRKVLNTVKSVFKGLDHRKLKKCTYYILSYFNLYPIIGLGYLIYLIATGVRPQFPPQNLLFDIFVHFPFWTFVFFVIQSVLLFLPLDIFYLLQYPFFKFHKEKIKSILNKIRFIIIVFFVIYTPLRTVYDYFTVAVRPVEYFKTNLHHSLEDFKIVLISDVQADRFTNRSRLGRYIEKVNAAKPDLVLIAGDIITSTPNYINLGAEFLGKIKSKYGVYSCVGDHDNWAYRNDVQKSLREVKEALANVNVKMLDNEKLTLTIDSAKIGIAFITNTYVEKIDPKILDSLTNITNGYDLRMFLTHQPRQILIEQAHKQKYDLFFAGHTHGGQLTFLFPFYNLSPTLFETKYVRGNFRFDDMLAIVNRGLGMSLVPLRINSTPEVTVIQLSGRN